ncbi:imidazole glycerol phosphate synthase subunit HisH [Pelolinea submarina]|uniref:Imidazole glycerol phosphate synthase subunit HisH n=1 Tax=Pelolinea submarina TaxID=913107 RepID=A0A347ZTW3_9CHLR|nr:imidazole glycerol phosphate synthase subunit HisH [Pelolinea submarina]REG10673.1 glutamine amidotransferase [Pelolinea submarina]BBB48744.1 glutamine amidotransferase [Pelolinea submarina]
MIAVVNYGLGNLHSVQKAVAFVGGDPQVTDDPQVILNADKIILPGVGAFADGMRELDARGLTGVIKEAALRSIPLLGICLGMQLLFDESEEKGTHAGLELVPGCVVFFRQKEIKVPQIGWNQVVPAKESPLTQGIQKGAYFYFNHGYYCCPQDEADVLLTTDYGLRYASAVQRGNVFGVQFHPEKSQKCGLQLLKNFVEMGNG